MNATSKAKRQPSSKPASSPQSGSPKPAAAVRRTPATRSTAAKTGSAARASKGGFPGGRKGKFNASGEFVGSQWCASASEAERYRQLLVMLGAGRIDNLKCQPKYPLVVNNVVITAYRADFCYDIIDERGREIHHVIEDVKGMITPEFALKHKLFDALYPTPLTVIRVKGQAKHSATGIKSGAGWMDLHWKNRLPI